MLLDLKNCKGYISFKDNKLECSFNIVAAKDGTINVDIEEIPLNQGTFWLIELSHKKGREFPWLKLKGVGPNNEKIISDYFFITSWRDRTTPSESSFKLGGSCSRIIIKKQVRKHENKNQYPLLQYYLLGLECFGRITGKDSCGTISIQGNVDVKNHNEVTGIIMIDGSVIQISDYSKWIVDCDKKVRLILDILSLANGHYIDWTVQSLFLKNSSQLTLTGTRKTNTAMEPLFCKLRLQPILDLAISNYSEALKEKTGLDIAIEWYLTNPTYEEMNFLACMTALEHLVFEYIEKNRKIIFPEKKFKKILKPLLKQAIDNGINRLIENIDDFDNQEKIFEIKNKSNSTKEKIPELNRYTFKENLFHFLVENEVPLSGIEINDIEKIIKIRHTIVHQGLRKPESLAQSLGYYLAVLRELLKRIFLKLLNYQGEYQSFIDGPMWVKFPPENNSKA